MKKTTLIAVGSAAILATVLTGCSAGAKHDTTDSAKTPKAAATSEAVATPNTCDDGQLTVTDVAKSKAALAKGCDTISLLTNGETVKIGPTKLLGIEGSDNTIKGTEIGAVHAMGSGNTIQYTGAAPDTEHLGDDNHVEEAK